MLHVVRFLVHELRAPQSDQIDDHTLVLTGAHIVYVDVRLGRYPCEVYPTPEHPLYENNEPIRAHADKQDDERDARPFARSILYDPLMILHRLHVSDAHAVKLVGVSPIRHSHRVPWNSLSVLPTFALQTKYYGNPFAHLFTRAPALHKCDRECAKWPFDPTKALPWPQKYLSIVYCIYI